MTQAENGNHTRGWRRSTLHPTALIVAGVGLGLSVAAYLVSYRETGDQEQAREAEVAQVVANRVGDRLTDVDDLVDGLQGALIANPRVTQTDLERYMALRLEETDLITSATLLAAAEGSRLDLFAQTGPSRYLDLDALAADLDLLDQRLASMAEVRPGEAGLLVSEVENDGTHAAMVIVFTTPAGDEFPAATWVVAIETLFTRGITNPISAGLPGRPAFATYLGSGVDPDRLLFATTQDAPEEAVAAGQAPLGDNQLTVTIAPTTGVLEAGEQLSPLTVLLAGLLLTSVLTPLVGRLASRREEVRVLSDQRDELDTALAVSRRIEGELRSSEQRFRSVLQSSPDIVLWIDTASAALQVLNRDDFLAHDASDLNLARLADLVHDDDRDVLRRGLDEVRGAATDSPAEFECRVRNGAGGWDWLRWRGARVQREGPAGPVLAVVSVITGQKEEESRRAQLEGQLVQAQRLEAVGQLAGGVAHDFNNILAAIVSGAELVLDEVDGQVREDVVEIRRTARRGSDLARQLLLFSRRDRGSAPEVVDVNEVISDISTMLTRTLDESVELRFETAEEVPPIHIDPTQIERVLMNLTINARDAMPHGGTITVTTSTVDLDEDAVATLPGLQPGPHLCLEVSDTGEGMPEEVRAHAFEPFFSTKKVGKGTGLGLATVYGVVQGAQGHIAIDSELGRGTTFRILLPRTRVVPVGGVVDATEGTVRVAGGDERILVVEDEDGVRDTVCRLLQKHGYQVTVAPDGPHALEQVCADTDLVLSDVLMPGGMNGREVASAVRQRFPDCAVLYMTGHSDDVLDNIGIDDDTEEALVVRKPFTEQELLRALRLALAQVPDRVDK